ncbi:hypothetical protein Hanom_Chr01g00001301 [Helianthus anomalus]
MFVSLLPRLLWSLHLSSLDLLGDPINNPLTKATGPILEFVTIYTLATIQPLRAYRRPMCGSLTPVPNHNLDIGRL